MPTKEELMEQATELDIEGRSTMSKGELEKAVAKASGSSDGELAEHEQRQAERGRSTGLSYREGR